MKDVYVANRVAEFQTLIISLGITVNYVPTNDNPADLVSRGCTVNKLKTSNWMHGPAWLITQEYPIQDNVKVVVVQELTVEINPINHVPPIIDLTRYNKFVKAERVMLKVLQFLNSNSNPFVKLISQEQKFHCNSIYSYLVNPNINVNVEVKNTIRDLNLVLHNDVIKAKRRLKNAELPVDAKTPYFLPNRSRLVDFLINPIHESNNHCGASQTLSLYRQQIWKPKIRTYVKSCLFRCDICRRIKGRTVPKPLPPPLPKERVRWQTPFTTVGVDHTGFFTILDPSGEKRKAYVCLSICATTQAVQLEAISDLSVPSFLLCLRRLAAAKGAPSTILSDTVEPSLAGNVSSLEMQDDPQVQAYLADHRIVWRHQTPRSPWMGGHYERLVRIIKVYLSTAITRKIFTYEEFVTLVKEAETIVNSRPITYQSADTDDIPLSLSQLAWRRSLTLMPRGVIWGVLGGSAAPPRLRLPPSSLNLPPTSPKPQEVTAAGFPLFLPKFKYVITLASHLVIDCVFFLSLSLFFFVTEGRSQGRVASDKKLIFKGSSALLELIFVPNFC